MIKRPVYHYHLQKTGGTSINHAFCSLVFTAQDECTPGMSEGETIYVRMSRKQGHTVSGNGFQITGHMQPAPGFSYGHSHLSASDLRLPKDAFTFAVFRDPVERVISFYRNSLDIWREHPERIAHHGLTHVQDALDRNDFGLFIEQVIPSWLSHQLWVFSKDYDVNEAVRRIKALDCLLFTETLRDDFQKLCEMVEVDLSLKFGRANRSFAEVEITPEHLRILREKLASEYRLLKAVRRVKLKRQQPWHRKMAASLKQAGEHVSSLWQRGFAP